MTKNYVYTDLQSEMETTTIGGFKVLHDAEVIIQSIRTIFATINGERVRNPIGSVLIKLLFEPMNEDTAFAIKSVVHRSVLQFEPRMENVEVSIFPDYDNNTYRVELLCKVRKLNKLVRFQTSLRSMYS